MDKTYIIGLLQRYLSNEATHAEREALFAELEKHKNNEDWIDIHTQLLSAEELKDYNPERYQFIIDTILKPKASVIPMYRRKAFKWIAAALFVGVLATAVVSVLTNNHRTTTMPVAQTHDITAPANTRAVITLADGSKVYLDSSDNGTIAQQNNVNVVKKANGEIIYSHEGTKAQSEIAYNTLFNPRGSKVISLTLSDGTKVWLNSESSLKYPIEFAANTREVEITGEAYFEVKHNAKQPFKVHLPNGSIVEDIGTSFNVNAYTDEEAIKTTLIEGSVRIVNESPHHQITKSQILKPGEQAITTGNSLLTTRPDLDEVMSWKNGLFNFDGADLETIMRQVARWYDVDVVYEGNVTKEPFKGEINRNVPASKVLQMLEYLGVKFKIEGKKITVMK